jgi:hypothetical protein
MQNLCRLILITGIIFSTVAQALDKDSLSVFVDVLYWKASESIDWAYDNSLTTPNQTVKYESGDFGYKPGFRVGLAYNPGDWETGIIYTKYSTDTSDSACGHLKSGFIGGTIGLPDNNKFYDAGQFKMKIDYNMIDWYIGKRFTITPDFTMRPTIGLQGGWIDQAITADFQGEFNTTEKIDNNFWGIGPKFGLDGTLRVLKRSNYSLSLLAEFSTAYLIGHWNLKDVYTDNSPRTIHVDLDNRDFGSLAIQARMGVALIKDNYTMSLSYEISDYFNQLQIFDDATGGHNNDLILQGLTLRLAYR